MTPQETARTSDGCVRDPHVLISKRSTPFQNQEVQYANFKGSSSLARVPQVTFKKNTIRTYESTMSSFRGGFTDRGLVSMTPDDVLSFLTAITDRKKQLTKRTRYSRLMTFFNFIKNNLSYSLSLADLNRSCLDIIKIGVSDSSRSIANIETFLITIRNSNTCLPVIV